MTGLRTIWGVSLQKIEQNFGKNYRTYLQNRVQKIHSTRFVVF